MRLGRMPQRCMTSPAMTKNGMASSGNESIPENISVGSTAIGTTPDSQMKASPPSPRQNATGTPSTMVTAKTATSTRISMGSQIVDPARRHVGAVPQRDDSTQERDPDHRVPRQLLGEDERGAEPVAEDDLHHDGQEHRADPDEGQRL